MTSRLILVSLSFLEGYFSIISAIQTDLSCHFLLTVDFLGLRRSEPWPKITDQARDCLEQLPRHRNLGELKCDITAVADHLGSNLDQFLPQCGHRPVLHFFRESQRSHEVAEIVGECMKLQPDLVVAELPA
jgi:hypothetical protein